MAYIDWWNRMGPVTLGERFGLNEGGRINMKPGGIVEPGVTNYGVKTRDTSRPQNRPAPMSKELETWYEKNKGTLLKDVDGNLKPAQAWEDLTVNERMSIKSQFVNRNNPKQVNLRNLDILKDFLQEQKDAGRTVFKKTLPEIAKEAKLTLKGPQVANIIHNYFPDTFNYQGLDLNKAPGVLKRVKALAKTKTANEITKILFDEGLAVSKNDVSVRQLMKDNKIPIKIATRDIDNLVKTYVKNNPKITDVNQIAKNLNIDPTTVRLAADRLNIKNLTSLQTGILKEIKALDDIVKNSIDIINDPNMTTPAKNRILQEHYLKATGKKFANLSTSELGNRLSRLAKLYAGEGRIHAFKNIKSPLNYLDLSNPLQRNIIEMVSQAKRINNFDMGQMLGLPKNQLKLISDTRDMMKAFDFSVAGDHTDIKSMMKDFPNYKKNFLKIEYIKSNLNLYKRKYDLQINALRKKAQEANHPGTKQKFLDDAKILQETFATNTGYRIGTFDIKNNRVVLNPKTERLIDLKNPLNTVLQTAMKNFATTSSPETGKILAAKKEIFSSLDKKLSNIKTGVEERIEIFKKIQGTNAAKQSQYLKALSKIPGKYGRAAKAITLGTASALTIATLASAGTTLEKGITTKEMKERKANAETLETSDETQESNLAGNLTATAAAGAITAKNPAEVYELAKKPVRFGWRAFERMISPGATAVLHGILYKITGEKYDFTKTENLLVPSFWNNLMKKYNWAHKSTDPLRRKLLNFLKRGAIPSSIMPLVSKIAGWAMIPAELYQATKTITKTIPDKEKEIAQWAKDNNYDPEKAVKMYRVTFDQPKFTRETFYKPMAMMNVPWGDVDLLKDPQYEKIKKSFDDEFRAKYFENKEEDVMKGSVIDKDDLATGGIASLLK